MRFAISAVAALSGLLLLALSFYGQPAVYLGQARQQWRELVQAPSDEVAKPLEADADAARVAQLQQQVAELEHQLASGTPQVGASTPAGSPTALPGLKSAPGAPQQGAPQQQALLSQPASPPAADATVPLIPQRGRRLAHTSNASRRVTTPGFTTCRLPTSACSRGAGPTSGHPVACRSTACRPASVEYARFVAPAARHFAGYPADRLEPNLGSSGGASLVCRSGDPRLGPSGTRRAARCHSTPSGAGA